MNHHLYLSLSFSLILWLAACTLATPPPTITPAPTIHTESETTPTATPPPTLATTATEQAEAALIPTFTLLPTLTPTVIPAPTETAIPSSTPTATPLPLALPAPTGGIYFLWDSQLIPSSISGGNPEQSLYLASPGKNIHEWQLNPILEGLVGWPQIVLSPDNSKMALTQIEDANNDGHASQESANRGADGYGLYVFSLADYSFERLDFGFLNPGTLNWLLDNETIAFTYWDRIFLLKTDYSPPQKITIRSELIKWTNMSPDGQLMAINYFESGQVALVNLNTEEEILVFNEADDFFVAGDWSSDGKWLPLNQPSTNQLFLLNIESLEVVPISVELVHFLAWSPNNSHLAFLQDTSDGSNLLVLKLEDLSYTQLLNVTGSASNIRWSPDSTQLAVTILHEETLKLGIVDVDTGVWRELWQSNNAKRFYIPTWSPDGEWLLFVQGTFEFSNPEEKAGVYVIHRNGGEPYLLLDISGSFDPYGFHWLPDIDTQ